MLKTTEAKTEFQIPLHTSANIRDLDHSAEEPNATNTLVNTTLKTENNKFNNILLYCCFGLKTGTMIKK